MGIPMDIILKASYKLLAVVILKLANTDNTTEPVTFRSWEWWHSKVPPCLPESLVRRLLKYECFGLSIDSNWSIVSSLLWSKVSVTDTLLYQRRKLNSFHNTSFDKTFLMVQRLILHILPTLRVNIEKWILRQISDGKKISGFREKLSVSM